MIADRAYDSSALRDELKKNVVQRRSFPKSNRVHEIDYDVEMYKACPRESGGGVIWWRISFVTSSTSVVLRCVLGRPMSVTPRWFMWLAIAWHSPKCQQALGHVSFYFAEDERSYHILGGNQSNMVNVARLERNRFLAARWPLSALEPQGNAVLLADVGTGGFSTGES